MAILPETSNFDTSVDRILTTDLVLGDASTGAVSGPANLPSQNLTNRTRWLYDQNAANVAAIAAANAAIATKAPLNSPGFTGAPTVPTPAIPDASVRIPNTAWVMSVLGAYALVNSPAFSGFPTAPTPATNDNSTKLATTAFVQALVNPGRSAANPGYFKTGGGDMVMRGSVHIGDIVGPIGGGISFPTSFGATPYIVVSLYDANNFGASEVCTVEGTPSPSGFSWAAREINSVVQNCTLFWHAIGVSP